MGNRRIWCGLGIMAAGLCAAWPFRKTWLEEQDALIADTLAVTAPMAPSLQPAKLTESRLPEDPAADSTVDEAAPALAGLHPLTLALERGSDRRPLVKLDQTPRVPALPPDASAFVQSPHVDPRAAILGAEDPSTLMTEIPAPQQQRRYRIGKHDTLESIAERLLGSREHAGKLVAANPDVILAPEVLPVGATIVIPEVSLPPEAMVRLPEPGP